MSKAPGRFGKFTEAEVKAGTDAGTGRGNPKLHESSGIEDVKGFRTQTIKRAYPLDTSDMELPNETGMAGFGGSPENLCIAVATKWIAWGLRPPREIRSAAIFHFRAAPQDGVDHSCDKRTSIGRRHYWLER